MKLPSLSTLFKKKSKTLLVPDSLLIKELKSVCQNNSLKIYENITIYHHTQSYFLPLIIVDVGRGIYLFEHKQWSFNELKDSKISKATNQSSDSKNLAYEKSHEFIKQKFNELTHSDGVEIYNFLLMENLNTKEYQHLDSSFQELLPSAKIMFSDSSKMDILKKLKATPPSKSNFINEAYIVGNLLVQYLILLDDNKIDLATDEQIKFIESSSKGLETLSAIAYSGKTSAILSKAILESLRNPQMKIMIIAPSILACDILRKKLLSIIEYAIIEVDLTTIDIVSPIELVNKHLSKLKKPNLEVILHIDDELMQKSLNVADLIICDDSHLLSLDFIDYLKHIQKDRPLVLVDSYSDKDASYRLKKVFRPQTLKIEYKKANQHAKALQIVSNLLRNEKAEDILMVGDNLSIKKLQEDLKFFVKEEVVVIDGFKNLQYQDLNNLSICSYSQIAGLSSKYTLLVDVEKASLNELEHALNLSLVTSFVLYEQESQNLKLLKEKYA